MNYKRGKRNARPDAVQMKFGAYLRAALPAVPLVFGRPGLVQPILGGNDNCGDCTIVARANGLRLMRRYAGLSPVTFITRDLIADYSAAGAPDGYVVGRPETDNGLDLQVAAKYFQQTGFMATDGNRYRSGPYAALRVGDVDEIVAAGYFLGDLDRAGCVDIGVQLPSNAEDQFDMGEVWDEVIDNSGGGHDIEFVGRNSAGNLLFWTWGRLHAATPAWVRACMDEGIVTIFPAMLGPNSPIDVVKLNDDYRQLVA